MQDHSLTPEQQAAREKLEAQALAYQARQRQELAAKPVVNIIPPRVAKDKTGMSSIGSVISRMDLLELPQAFRRMTEDTQKAEAEVDRLGAACRANELDAPPCYDLGGILTVLGRKIHCRHFCLDCPAGQQTYRLAATQFIESLKLGERYQMAHFLHPRFIHDAVSDAPRRYAMEGKLEEGRHLIIGGTKGSGKTMAAIAIGCHARTLGMQVLYLKAVDFLLEFETDKAMVEKAKEAPVLILDDLGTELRHVRNDQTLFRVIDHRLEQDRPTIITCNKSKADLIGKKGTDGRYTGGIYTDERLIDRLEMFLMSFTNEESKREKPGKK